MAAGAAAHETVDRHAFTPRGGMCQRLRLGALVHQLPTGLTCVRALNPGEPRMVARIAAIVADCPLKFDGDKRSRPPISPARSAEEG